MLCKSDGFCIRSSKKYDLYFIQYGGQEVCCNMTSLISKYRAQANKYTNVNQITLFISLYVTSILIHYAVVSQPKHTRMQPLV